MHWFDRAGRCAIGRRLRLELRALHKRKMIISAVIFVLIGILDAIICGNFYMYHILILPKSAPGKWCFILVWTVLYALLGVSLAAAMANKQRYCASDRTKGIILFACMMIFNLIWCPLFFGAGAFFSAFIDIVIMIILVYYTAAYFYKVSLIAAGCQIILGIWLIYCACLNLGIMLIN